MTEKEEIWTVVDVEEERIPAANLWKWNFKKLTGIENTLMVIAFICLANFVIAMILVVR